MLLYNQRKEFIGIDEDDLSSLDFQSINELQNESHDFADLFVKKPGFIHNFKNFSWIDFILHSEADESKAIIHAKGRNYACALHVTPFHFTSEESGFMVTIKNLRALKGAEDAQANKDLEASGGIQASPAPVSKPAPSATPAAAATTSYGTPELDISLDDIQISEPEISNEPTPTPEEETPELPSFEQSPALELHEPDLLDIPEPAEIDLGLSSPDTEEFDTPSINEFGAPVDIDYNAPLTLDDDVMADEIEEPAVEEKAPAIEEEVPAVEEEPVKRKEQPMLGDYVSQEGSEHLSDLVRSGDYQYDPSVAANELGLPVDLIEEFIGDFIDQAHEFHDDLFASVKTGDFDNVQILSHKLKGVAANLRVEDTFDVLSVVNTSKDVDEVLPNLNHFYKIIAKLEGKEIPEAAPAVQPPLAADETEPSLEDEPAAITEDEGNYGIEIKQPEEGPLLIDEEVTPMPEDDIYDDLLSSPTQNEETYNPPLEESTSSDIDNTLDDDIYDDLLGAPSDDHVEETPSTTDETLDEDIYDDLLGSPANDYIEESIAHAEVPAPAPAEDDLYDDLIPTSHSEDSQKEVVQQSDIAPMNFDAQKSANELGIPVDVVNEFVQDFKEQLKIHQNDFRNAIAEANIKDVNKTATLLKGMSDNLRLNEISDVLKALQAEQDINKTEKALETLQAYADQL